MRNRRGDFVPEEDSRRKLSITAKVTEKHFRNDYETEVVQCISQYSRCSSNFSFLTCVRGY